MTVRSVARPSHWLASVTSGLMAKPDPVPMPETPIGEAFARNLILDQLRRSEAVQIIASTLNGLELERDGLKLCRLADRDFPDFLRLVRKAKAIVRSVTEDVEADALEEVAIVIAEGSDAEYAKLTDQLPSVQANYRRQAVHAINAYWAKLEGREAGDLR